MGGCSSSAAVDVRQRRRHPPATRLSKEAFDEMQLEELISLGIAEAQLATVARKRNIHARHVRAARAVLTAAAGRCQDTEQMQLRAHLVAVLLKLGAVPAELMSTPEMEENRELGENSQAGLRAVAGCAADAVRSPPTTPRLELQIAAPDLLPKIPSEADESESAHSSEVDEAGLQEYIELDADMDAAHLLDDDDDEDGTPEEFPVTAVTDGTLYEQMSGDEVISSSDDTGDISPLSMHGPASAVSSWARFPKAAADEESHGPASGASSWPAVPKATADEESHGPASAVSSSPDLPKAAADEESHGLASAAFSWPAFPKVTADEESQGAVLESTLSMRKSSSENGQEAGSRVRAAQPMQQPQIAAKRRRVKKDCKSAEAEMEASGGESQHHDFAPPPRHSGRQPSHGNAKLMGSPASTFKEKLTPINADFDLTEQSAVQLPVVDESKAQDFCMNDRQASASTLQANAKAFVEFAAKSATPNPSVAISSKITRGGPDLLPCERSFSQHTADCVSPVMPSLAASSPFCWSASPREELAEVASYVSASPAAAAATDTLSVKILNGFSGEEEAHFALPVEECYSEQHFMKKLEQLSQQHVGQSLADLNWLKPRAGGRFERCQCDIGMVEDFFNDRTLPSGGPALLLCTVPVTPPSELLPSRTRLRSLAPDRIKSSSSAATLRFHLETSLLEDGHDYSVALTHQWSNVTYVAEAQLLSSMRGVVFNLPPQLRAASNSSTEGLYDVHLVMDRTMRSQNRRGLTVGSAESDLSSSTSVSSFLPIR